MRLARSSDLESVEKLVATVDLHENLIKDLEQYNSCRRDQVEHIEIIEIIVLDLLRKEGRKEGSVLFTDALNTFLFTVIWHQTYGKGPLR